MSTRDLAAASGLDAGRAFGGAPTPQTPLDKLKNFWFYYKWWVVGGAVLLIVAIILAVNLLSNKKADIDVMLVTEKEPSPAFKQAVSEALGQTVGDVNGDGEVVVNVLAFTIDPDDMQAQSMIASYAVQISSGPAALYIADEYGYEDLVRREAVEPLTGLIESQQLGGDGGWWPLAGSDFAAGTAFANVDAQELALYRVCIRAYTGTGWEADEEKTTEFNLAVTTLQAMIDAAMLSGELVD